MPPVRSRFLGFPLLNSRLKWTWASRIYHSVKHIHPFDPQHALQPSIGENANLPLNCYRVASVQLHSFLSQTLNAPLTPTPNPLKSLTPKSCPPWTLHRGPLAAPHRPCHPLPCPATTAKASPPSPPWAHGAPPRHPDPPPPDPDASRPPPPRPPSANPAVSCLTPQA